MSDALNIREFAHARPFSLCRFGAFVIESILSIDTGGFISLLLSIIVICSPISISHLSLYY